MSDSAQIQSQLSRISDMITVLQHGIPRWQQESPRESALYALSVKNYAVFENSEIAALESQHRWEDATKLGEQVFLVHHIYRREPLGCGALVVMPDGTTKLAWFSHWFPIQGASYATSGGFYVFDGKWNPNGAVLYVCEATSQMTSLTRYDWELQVQSRRMG